MPAPSAIACRTLRLLAGGIDSASATVWRDGFVLAGVAFELRILLEKYKSITG